MTARAHSMGQIRPFRWSRFLSWLIDNRLLVGTQLVVREFAVTNCGWLWISMTFRPRIFGRGSQIWEGRFLDFFWYLSAASFLHNEMLSYRCWRTITYLIICHKIPNHLKLNLDEILSWSPTTSKLESKIIQKVWKQSWYFSMLFQFRWLDFFYSIW